VRVGGVCGEYVVVGVDCVVLSILFLMGLEKLLLLLVKMI